MLNSWCEVEGHSRDEIRRFRGNDFPRSCDGIRAMVGRMALDGEETNIGIIGDLHHVFRVLREAQREPMFDCPPQSQTSPTSTLCSSAVWWPIRMYGSFHSRIINPVSRIHRNLPKPALSYPSM